MEYGLRALGHPVVQVNVDESQLQDRIDDALDLWWEYHNEGTELTFLNRQITQGDKDTGSIQLPETVMSVVDVIQGSGIGSAGSGIASIDNLQYRAFMTDVMNVNRITAGGLSTFYMAMSNLSLIGQTFGSRKRLDFEYNSSQLTLQGNWDLQVGDWIAIECYVIIDPDEVGKAYNSRWLKKYIVAAFKKQWGDNLIKYGGAQLPGGVTINAERIYEDGRADCVALEEELRNNYEEPIDFYMG